MNLVGVKITVLILLGLIKLGSGLLPLLLVKLLKKGRMKWIEDFMAGLMCIGGGVLLATVFIHMLPEVRMSLEEVRDEAGEDSVMAGEFPFAELTLCAGFFVIYLIEALVHRIFRIQSHSHGIPIGLGEPHGHSHGDDHGHSHGQAPVENGSAIKMDSLEKNGQVNPVFIIENGATSNGHAITSAPDLHPDEVTWNSRTSYGNNKYRCKPEEAVANGNKEKYLYNASSATLTSYISYTSEFGSLEDVNSPKENNSSESSQSSPSSLTTQQTADTSSVMTSSNGRKKTKDVKKVKPVLNAAAKEKKFLSSIRSFVIVLALSIHSIFEGMAIGLQPNAGDVWKLFAAVAIHECAILFCVGNEMVNNGIKKCQIISYMLTLGLVTPIGIIIGIVLTSSDSSQTLVVGVMQGLAGGTLLYVTFFEVLEREKLEKVGMTGLLGAFLLIVGFSMMAGLEAVGGHDHGSDNYKKLVNSTNETSFMGGRGHGHGHGHSHSHGHGHGHGHSHG